MAEKFYKEILEEEDRGERTWLVLYDFARAKYIEEQREGLSAIHPPVKIGGLLATTL